MSYVYVQYQLVYIFYWIYVNTPLFHFKNGHDVTAHFMIGRTDPGGHSHWKGVWGCAAVMTPFFQASRRSLAHQFTINALLLCPLLSIFRHFLHFQPCFGQNFSSLDPNFSKFLFPRPHFLKENPLPRPYILKPAWHTPTKKKVDCPPGTDICALLSDCGKIHVRLQNSAVEMLVSM